MQQPVVIKLAGQQPVTIKAVRLTGEAFAPFGDVVENPRPDLHPSSAAAAHHHALLPSHAVAANQGSAIKYQNVSRQVNLYNQAPSRRPAAPAMSMFTCAARARVSAPDTFAVSVLERHPFTTQTFVPLTASPEAHFLVIVAPTLPSSLSSTSARPSLPVPTELPPSTDYPRRLPGAGLPDLRGLRAFVATAAQAVTYGAGTWHAPMVALGEPGTAMDFVVVQFANGVAIEDCQEVFLEGQAGNGISIKLGTVKEQHKARL